MSCLNNTFKGSLQNLQLPLLGSCMAPVVEPLSTTPGGKSIAVRISVIGNAVQIPTLPLIRKKNLQLLRPIMSLIKSLWAIRNSHSVFQFSSASNAADDEEYQYYRDRALAYAGTTPTVTNLQTCPGNSYLVSQFFSVSDAEDDEAEYQYYRDRALAYAGITPTVTTLQTCPGNSYLVSQFSSASEADDDEAEYHYHRHRALVRPHRPLPEQNITDTRGSHLGLAPFSPSGIGCSSLCLHNSVE